MYVCLCKALTDSDVRLIARTLAGSGVRSIDDFLAFLDLDNISGCGLCAQEPEQFIALATSEWAQNNSENVEDDEGTGPTSER